MIYESVLELIGNTPMLKLKKEDENKTISDMMELIKKLQDDKTREKVTEDKNEEDILKDMFRDFM